MNKKTAKRIYWSVGIALNVLCFLLAWFYRPYAYSHNLNDFYFADCYSSLICVPAFVCGIQMFFSKEKYAKGFPKNILLSLSFFAFFEIIDAILRQRVDWVDITALCISATLTYILYRCFGFKTVAECTD